MAFSVYGGKNECLKKCPKNFQMSEKYWNCLDKMSEVNFSPVETLIKSEDVATVRSSELLAKLEDLNRILRERRLC